MTDIDRNQASSGQELCVGNTCQEEESGEVVAKNDGSKEYEQGKILRDQENYPEAIKAFSLAADLGNTGAMIALGNLYSKGQGVEKSFEKAKYYYDMVIKAGSAYGEYKLGRLYETWQGAEQDLSAALYHYIQSAESGNKWGAYWVGKMYYKSEIVTKDYAKAVRYLMQAAEADVIVTALVTIYNEGGYGIEKDNEKALYYANLILEQLKTRTSETVIANTEKSLSHDLLLIAADFDKEGNYLKAIMLYEQVLSFKNTFPFVSCVSSIMLGSLYYNGKGIEQNFAKSFEYYEAASNIEDCGSFFLGKAQTAAGRMLFIGRGVEKDVDRAFELLENAYKLDYEGAAGTLCAIYINGYEVERDCNKAIPYCEKEIGEKKCNHGLGILYYCTKQYKRAFECFKNDAETDTFSAFAIAVMYVNGKGVEKNFELAKEWIEKSDEVQQELFLESINSEDKTLPDSEGTEYHIDIFEQYSKSYRVFGNMGLTKEEEMSFFDTWSEWNLTVEQKKSFVQILGNTSSTIEEE